MEAQIQEWKDRAEALKPLNLKQIEPNLAELDAHLTLRSHIVGYTVSDADTTVWQTLRGNRVAHAYIKQNLRPNLCRWFRYIEEAYPQQAALPERPKEKAKDGEKQKDDGANYDIGLQDVGDGTGVVTRFPPEPSYVFLPLPYGIPALLIALQRLSAHWTRQSCPLERLLCARKIQGYSDPSL